MAVMSEFVQYFGSFMPGTWGGSGIVERDQAPKGLPAVARARRANPVVVLSMAGVSALMFGGSINTKAIAAPNYSEVRLTEAPNGDLVDARHWDNVVAFMGRLRPLAQEVDEPEMPF